MTNNPMMDMFMKEKDVVTDQNLMKLGAIASILLAEHEFAEMAEEKAEEAEEEIKDELEAGESKFKLYEKTKDVKWLKASDSEVDHAALYMVMYNDYGMKGWHDEQKARNKAEMIKLGLI